MPLVLVLVAVRLEGLVCAVDGALRPGSLDDVAQVSGAIAGVDERDEFLRFRVKTLGFYLSSDGGGGESGDESDGLHVV